MPHEPSQTEPPRGDSAGDAVSESLRRALLQRLLAHDKHGAVAVALTAIRDRRIGIPDLYMNVLCPALVSIGARWQEGRTAVWEEHLASAAVRTIVEALYPEVERQRASVAPAGHRVVLASPPEESHDLGLRMLADRLALAGWEVFYLGPDTPAADLIDAARALEVEALILSSSTHYHRLRMRELVTTLAEALPNVQVWVGGPGFVGVDDEWAAAHLFDERVLGGTGRTPGDASC